MSDKCITIDKIKLINTLCDANKDKHEVLNSVRLGSGRSLWAKETNSNINDTEKCNPFRLIKLFRSSVSLKVIARTASV
eukprot:SAG22_NODE_3990_length_1434_cov_2.810487_3_plen_79_part_00